LVVDVQAYIPEVQKERPTEELAQQIAVVVAVAEYTVLRMFPVQVDLGLL
jgi:hypothetical protein